MSAGTIVLVGTAVFAVGCATGGTGLRDGGPARSEAVAKAGTAAPAESSSPSDSSSSSSSSSSSDPSGDVEDPGSPSAAPFDQPLKKVDPVKLLMADPKVSPAVKRDLKPCSGKEYPVDVSYGRVTGSPVVDIVVNVLSCADALGRGSYVYRADGGKYENVFSDEQPPIYAEIDRGDLVVTKQVYGKSDALAYPSGEDVITYHWTGDRFTEQDRVHSEYSNVVDGGGQPAPAVTQKN
ncbi:hypothetical protein OG625_21770 [Streptomyces sp. NBC_01351]|uniref:hypothetical protein n=1 Tax=Streptomyces sp. NBC_01351 TaxID=2903833 RepID=UPI002E35F53A|nr:hypothetical protein [Streptomyces sp. NBC_01351]